MKKRGKPWSFTKGCSNHQTTVFDFFFFTKILFCMWKAYNFFFESPKKSVIRKNFQKTFKKSKQIFFFFFLVIFFFSFNFIQFYRILMLLILVLCCLLFVICSSLLFVVCCCLEQPLHSSVFTYEGYSQFFQLFQSVSSKQMMPPLSLSLSLSTSPLFHPRTFIKKSRSSSTRHHIL